jgi:hypothetical protein
MEENKELKKYIWKTIKNIEKTKTPNNFPESERIRIYFTNWELLDLYSWDYESYISWISISYNPHI